MSLPRRSAKQSYSTFEMQHCIISRNNFCHPTCKMAATTGQSFNIGPYGENILKLFFTVPFKSKFGLEFTL